MITKDDVIELVGKEHYWQASKAAKAVSNPCSSPAADLGMTNIDAFVTDTAHKINDILAEDDPAAFVDPTPSQLPVILEIYQDIPDYAFLSICYMHYVSGQYSEAAAALLWTSLRSFLNSDEDAIAGPAEYVLWIDFFENQNTAPEAWRRMLAEPRTDILIRRVLGNSGPVPCELKFALYDELLPDERWHSEIFESLFASEFDVHGQLNTVAERKHARDLLGILKIEPDDDRFAMLSESLVSPIRDSQRELEEDNERIDNL